MNFKELYNLGFSNSQITQLLNIDKIKNINLSDVIIDEDNVMKMINIDSEKYRNFKQFCLDLDKKYINKIEACIFDALLNDVDYTFINNNNFSVPQIKVLCNSFIEMQKNKIFIDSNLFLDSRYSAKFLTQVFDDVMSKINVKEYLNNNLSVNRKKLIRKSMINNFNLTDDIKAFNCINDKNIEDAYKLKKTYGKGYILVFNKFTNFEIANFILEQKKDGINIENQINNKLPLECITELYRLSKSGKNISMFKHVTYFCCEKSETLIDIYSLDKKIFRSMDYRVPRNIDFIFDCLIYNKDVENVIDVNFILEHMIFFYLQKTVMKCYQTHNEQIIDALKNDWYYFDEEDDVFLSELIDINETLENKIDIVNIVRLMKNNNNKTKELSSLVKLLKENTLTNEFIQDLLNGSYNRFNYIVKALENKYDYNLLMDKNLTIEQMRCIFNCFEMGFSLELSNKEKYDEEINEENKASDYIEYKKLEYYKSIDMSSF